MYAVKVLAKDAEKAKNYLLETENLSRDYRVLSQKGFVYFGVISKSRIKSFTVVSVDLKKNEKKEQDFKELILNKLTEKERALLKTAFDHIGTIAILEIEEGLQKKEKLIAEALLQVVPSVKTVLKKVGIHEGVFRTQKMALLAGEDTCVTTHRENGVALTLDVEKVYFSPRSSNERKRIVGLVKKGESVLVMFSGCAPFPCVIGKNTQAKEIYGVELNSLGHEYGLKNVAANKLKNVFLYQGDVRTVVPQLKKKFDRILMPLPKSAEDFLDVALTAVKSKGIIHFYDFLHEDHFKEAADKIKTACNLAHKKCKILRTVKCGQYSPRTFRICVDFIVE
ncbi:MAG: class I SAM-dependent methyltransferase family protein [Candidatus Woesearchaeota archaeon]|jgi:tRNA (guanine37-N1)-methyltransferase